MKRCGPVFHYLCVQETTITDPRFEPGPEIAEAARQIAEISFGIEKEEFIQQVGRQLGFKRVGSNIRKRIGSIIDTMLGEGMLTQESGQIGVTDSEDSE